MEQGSGSSDSSQGTASHQGRQPHQTQKEGVHLSSPFSPFIIAQIFICKLFQKGPLHHSFGSFILEEVDEHVLQPRVAVRGGRLLGQLVEPGVLFVECLGRQLGVRKGAPWAPAQTLMPKVTEVP